MTAKWATIQQPLLGNGSSNRYERKNSTAIIAMQQRSGIFYAVRSEKL
jgi:hypothetical protein